MFEWKSFDSAPHIEGIEILLCFNVRDGFRFEVVQYVPDQEHPKYCWCGEDGVYNEDWLKDVLWTTLPELPKESK
jgi:hypothetical protein